MTKLLIAIAALLVGFVSGRSLSVGDIQAAAKVAPAADAPYNVPGEGLQIMQVQLDQANLRIKTLESELAKKDTQPTTESPLNDTQSLALKRAFEDLQGEVLAEKYPGLALSESYQTMKSVLANPEIK